MHVRFNSDDENNDIDIERDSHINDNRRLANLNRNRSGFSFVNRRNINGNGKTNLGEVPVVLEAPVEGKMLEETREKFLN